MSDDLISRLVERLRAWQDLSEWANAGWELPPKATEALRNTCRQAADALAAERARADAAERDAERYRWLLKNRVSYAMHMGAVLYTPELVVPRGMSVASTDAAIDAARKENPHD